MVPQVSVNLLVGLGVGIAAVEHTHTAVTVFLVQLRRQCLECFLVTIVITQQDDEPETRIDHAVYQLCINGGESLR